MGQRHQFGIRQVMQEEDGMAMSNRPSPCHLFEAGVADAEPTGVGARLTDRRRREIDSASPRPRLRRQQQFRIADAAPQAELRASAGRRRSRQDPPHHVGAQRAPPAREMSLRESEYSFS